jgi:hypothetical protein
LLAAVLAVVPVPSLAASSAPVGLRAMDMSTVPSTPGVRLRFAGIRRTVVTDHRGSAAVRLRVRLRPPRGQESRYRALANGTFFPQPTVEPRRLRDGGIAKLDRFFGGRIALALYYRFDPDFRGPDGSPIDQRLVQGYRLKSRTGAVIDVKGAQSVELQSTRVVPYTGVLVSKDIEWSLERVMVEGSNVVNRAQNRVSPHRLAGEPYSVRLLFYPVRLTARDAVFGFHTGKDVTLSYPNGKQRRLTFKNGVVMLPAVPRGTYTVKVNALGLSPQRPVAVSRPQDVELQVISWLDLVLGALLLTAFAVLLMVARRPHLRRLPWRRGPDPGVSGQEGPPPAEPSAEAESTEEAGEPPGGASEEAEPEVPPHPSLGASEPVASAKRTS